MKFTIISLAVCFGFLLTGSDQPQSASVSSKTHQLKGAAMKEAELFLSDSVTVPSNQVNVLSLGIKNDGSEDISETVNRATEKYALFFPAGTYKVAKPLFLKNPVFGAGYARQSKVTNSHTWFLSEIQCKDGSVGVLNTCGKDARNIENLNIVCRSHECGIRIADEAISAYSLIDKVAVYNVKGYGIFIHGRGSRPFFLQNITVWSSRELALPCEGIHLEGGSADNRFSNIEVMGCRISMSIAGGFHYGSNLHLWTGCMGWKDNGSWWRGTRGIVLKEAVFNASQVYPDTSFYALETRDEKSAFHLSNVFYWEDGSTEGSRDFDGAFFHGNGTCSINDGEIYVPKKGKKNGRMQRVRIPGTSVKNVTIRTDIPVSSADIDRLCAGNELPDYSLEYSKKGFCKAADIVLAAPCGCTDSILSLDTGEAYRICILRAENKSPETIVTNLNSLCRKDRVRIKETSKNVFSVFVLNDKDETLRLRFRTECMGERFRPLHFGLLRQGNHAERCKKILPQLPE